MAAPVKLNYKIYKGASFREVLRWESSTKVYVPITVISKSAPVVTAPTHEAPVGWRAKVVGGGMGEVLASGQGTNVSGNRGALVNATFGTSAAGCGSGATEVAALTAEVTRLHKLLGAGKGE